MVILVEELWLHPEVERGIPMLLSCITLFSGIQLMVLGVVGEYVGRVFLQQSGMPQYVVRYSMIGEQLHE